MGQRATRRQRATVCALAIASIGIGMLSCSSGSPLAPDPTLKTSGDIVYSRTRDSRGAIAPVLSEGTGFDGAEVDSPALVKDGGRILNDKFMMFYEAEDGGGTSTIGLITSNEEDFATRTIDRTQVVGLGPGGSPYESGATDPTVIVDKRIGQEAARYKMWFEGRSGGGISTILYGTSTDGVTWSSFVPCIGLGASFASVRVADPSVVLIGNSYRMWFEAINSSGSNADGPGTLGYAESADGVSWTIRDASGGIGTSAGPVLAAGSGFDGYGVNAPCVLVDTAFSPGAPGYFKLWYEAADKPGDQQNTIGYAISGNGLVWSRSTLSVFTPSSDNKIPLPFDSGDLEHPMAIIDHSIPPALEGHFLLWYTGDAEGGATPNRIGLAKGFAP